MGSVFDKLYLTNSAVGNVLFSDPVLNNFL